MAEKMFEWMRYYEEMEKKMKHGNAVDRILRIQLYEIQRELGRIADALERLGEKVPKES